MRPENPQPGQADQPDHEDTVLRPAGPPPQRDHQPDHEDTVLRPAADVEDTTAWAPPPPVSAPAEETITGSGSSPAPSSPPSDPDFIDSAPPRPAPSAGNDGPPADDGIPVFTPPPWGTYLHSSLDTEPPEPQQPQAPALAVLREHQPADVAPIQRFDQRPRFHLPPEQGPAPASPPSAAPGSRQPDPSSRQAASGSLPPGVDATSARRRHPLLVPLVAAGCAALLLLGIGGGAGLLLLNRGQEPATAGPSTTQTTEQTADPAQWRPLEEGESPEGTTEELLQVMDQNPLTDAALSVPASCSLPASEGKVPDDELQAYLEAGAACLATTWGTALEEQGVEFTAPEVVVHPAAEPPANSSCDPESFTGTAPRACIGDNTLYWPAEWDPGFSTTSAVESPQLYMWHLSYSYAVFAIASTSLHSYYGALLTSTEADPALTDEMRRRYALQQSCLGSAAAFQQPTGPRPTERVEEFVTSIEAQAEPASSAEPSAESRAAWVTTGRTARGDLSRCSTWDVPEEQVG